MLKLTSFVFSLLLFAVFSFAQTESGLTDEQRAYLEEFGNSTPNLLYSDDKIFSDDPSTWGSITSAPSFFGRPTMGVIGDYLYIHTSQNATSLALALHLPTNTWSTSTACNFPSFNNAYTVAHGQLYKLSSSGFERFAILMAQVQEPGLPYKRSINNYSGSKLNGLGWRRLYLCLQLRYFFTISILPAALSHSKRNMGVESKLIIPKKICRYGYDR
jgi:hypothetical protein